MTCPINAQTAVNTSFNNCADFRGIATQLALEVPAIILSNTAVLDIAKTQHEVWIRNNVNMKLHMTAYHYKQRRDTNTAVGSPTEFISNAVAAWSQGFINMGMPGGVENAIGVTPFESHDFGVYFKVTKVKKYTLGVGASIHYKHKTKDLTVSYNKVSDADAVGLKDLTTGILWLIRGECVAVAGSTAAFSIANIALNHISKFQLRNTQDFLTDVGKSIPYGALTGGAQAVTDYTLITAFAPATS